MIILCCLIGCKESEYFKSLRHDKEKATLSESHYCLSILHDEHLFIMSKYGHMIHHPNCPCCKNIPVEKTTPPAPIIIDFSRVK